VEAEELGAESEEQPLFLPALSSMASAKENQDVGAEGKRGACNLPPSRGLRTRNRRCVPRHDISRSHASNQ